jgi:probable selenium-dependent hydroxylase accessory protein YqeC
VETQPHTPPDTEQQTVQDLFEGRARIERELAKVIVGQKDVIEQLLIALFAGGHCLITGAPDGHGRMSGISPDIVCELHARSDVDAVLVEADGSRMLPFKAPAEHEPAIPSATTHLVPTMSIEVIGQPLDDDHVHRPERVASLTGLRLGDPVTVDAAAKVLAHPDGGARQRPARAQLNPLINKVENEDALRFARAIAEKLMQHPAMPVLEVWSPAARIIVRD